MNKQYAERDIVEQDEYYVRHVHAMTAEDLHSKSAIAAELAHRDMRIDSLKAKAAIADELAEALRGLAVAYAALEEAGPFLNAKASRYSRAQHALAKYDAIKGART